MTDEGESGLSMTSPQIPALVFGRATEQEFARDYIPAIRAELRGDVDVIGHLQSRGTTPQGDEVLLRRQQGADEKARLEVLDAVNRLLGSAEEASQILADLAPSATGEYIFVASLPTDTVGWLVDQLRPTREVITAVLDVAGHMVAMMQVASDDDLGWPDIEELGWDRNMTLGQLMTAHARSRGPLAVRA